MNSTLYRLTAFSEVSTGGNPAGVWIGDELPDKETMQHIAKEVGYSETAFIAPAHGATRQIRYFSPLAEVSFCGHATIASGVILGQSEGATTYQLETSVGRVSVDVHKHNGKIQAALTSVQPEQRPIPASLLEDILEILRWSKTDIDESIPPILAYGGAWHLILATKSLSRLNNLNYNSEKLKSEMNSENLTTLQLIFRENDSIFHSRNPFPVGGVVEDPATGAAAAALGGYLRDADLINVPGRILIKQGEKMGRPSFINVGIPQHGGIVVAGTAVEIT